MLKNGCDKTHAFSSATPVPASRGLRRTFLVGVGLAVLAVLSACSVGSSPRGELGQDKQILKSCDSSVPIASDVQIDGTGSSASTAITDERMSAIEQIVRTTAICSGRLRVSVFGASSAGTATLFDGSLHLDGATTNARLRRVPRVVDGAMTQIKAGYAPAVAGLKGRGSDVTSVYRLAEEWANQVGGDFRLHFYLFTDGLQNVGIDLGKKAISKQEVTTLANKTTVPKLPGASVTVAGLGRIAGTPPRSDLVESLVAYYDALCQKTGAVSCVSVTDYAAAGK